MNILGISAFYHDSAAALLVDGKIAAAAQEERFTRKKHDQDFPVHAIDYCLEEAGIGPEEIDLVGFYDKPFLKFDRLLETYLAYAPQGFKSFLEAMPLWLRKKLHLPREMRKGLRNGYRKRFVFTLHHESHAASAFFPSPFEEAAILTLDGVGEWSTASLGIGRGNEITLTHELRFPHSPGLLYAAFTYYCGFKVNSDEYKLMGLAPYGEPRYADSILENLIDLKDDGSFRMDMSYFNYCQGLTMTSKKFDALFGAPPLKLGGRLTQREMDLAASVQSVIEEIMLRMARHAHAQTGAKNLCLAGGVALNCVGNGRIQREGPFESLWIQPAADDAGGALGVALFAWHQLLGNPRQVSAQDSQAGSLLGPCYGDEEIRAFLDSTRADYEFVSDETTLCDIIAEEIEAGHVIGWFQGRMEFGPRALGARSILGDARSSEMQSVMNMKVKFRESFRPFAPVVLREHVQDYFDIPGGQESPYMLLVAPVKDDRRKAIPADLQDAAGIDKLPQIRSEIPSVTHVDNSARVQTVDAERHGLLRKLMETFYRKTGCPVMVNTSFNLGWDPIVCTPKDAYDTFMSCDIDVLCMGRHILKKRAQPSWIATADGRGRDEALEPLLASPCCPGAELAYDTGLFRCGQCNQAFTKEDGIWQMFWPHERFTDANDVTEQVKAFYEETPFPNYDDRETIRSLLDKARAGLYARALDRSIPYNSSVLEVGCGTGQLSNFLGISCRRIVGVDLCLNSLRLGERFRATHGLERISFMQMNLFRLAFKPEQFDVILCNGVLHHTSDPYGGFRGLLPFLKPGGHIVIGLYNRYGRLMTDFRRQIFRATRGRAKWIDPIIRAGTRSDAKVEAWFADQYRHPHESKHTIGEVLEWFADSDIEFLRGIPSVTPGPNRLHEIDLFEPEERGTRLDHVLVQLREIATGNREGGFFLMIGRKSEGGGDHGRA